MIPQAVANEKSIFILLRFEKFEEKVFTDYTADADT